MSKPEVKVNWASYSAAKYACERWHYSKCVPVGKLVKVGVWEDGSYIGVVIYGRGANKSLGAPYGLDQTECCELVRVALNSHKTPVSKILSLSLKLLKSINKKLRLIVSFADTEQGHHGGVYQASNWVYVGTTNSADEYIYKGKRWHGRAFRKSHGSHKNYIDKGLVVVRGSQKHRYVLPLDKKMADSVKLISKPYPKRVKQATPESNRDGGGAAPTHTLHTQVDA